MLLILSFFQIFFIFQSAHAEEEHYIVRYKNKPTLQSFQSRASTPEQKPLIESLQIYSLQSKPAQRMTLSQLQQDPNILYIQKDHKVSKRALLPDDPDLSKVWSLLNKKKKGADTSATKAWDFGTGGKNFNGQDIVVAVIDGGVDLTHVDLVENLWSNALEIPDNGVDDDQNGYIDDVHGWNSYLRNGVIPPDYHGTHVAGIIGAKGNNQSHASGINWDVKLLPVVGTTDRTSIILESYGYILAQKKLWLETGGLKGANIVAANSSFGIDLAQCNSNDYPVWNDLYNELGKVGILSVASTANQSYNVDIRGDVPTQCSSPYLVTVTNTTIKDKLSAFAAWGKKSIDLGAPGTEIWSTLPDSLGGYLSGTSMAAPQVAGAVALLHHLASKELSEYTRTHPAQAALVFKEALLKTSTPLRTLKKNTVSGGRLNLQKAALFVRNKKI